MKKSHPLQSLNSTYPNFFLQKKEISGLQASNTHKPLSKSSLGTYTFTVKTSPVVAPISQESATLLNAHLATLVQNQSLDEVKAFLSTHKQQGPDVADINNRNITVIQSISVNPVKSRFEVFATEGIPSKKNPNIVHIELPFDLNKLTASLEQIKQSTSPGCK
ncbi:MAG: hypothetical protein JSS53_02915 [Proteobacteria bacterium]|nr:hypothetical protein [Pseudomonadota bacterium]